MSFLSKMKAAPHHLPHGTSHRRGLVGLLVDKGERYGASLAFGYIKGYYRERAQLRGIPIELAAGVAGLAGSALFSLFSSGRSDVAPHFERIGDAGMQGYLNSVATSWGTTKSGRQVMVLDQGAGARAQIPGKVKQSVVGDIPPAMGGAYLTPDQIANFAARR
jgi:hypothetical protein